jgi:uncharacterized protein involved in exopolysaccharide biosynthesis
VQDEINVRTYEQMLGPDNPKLIAAEAQLSVDRANLQQQVYGMHAGLSSDQVLALAELSGMRSRRAAIEKQIAETERRVSITRGYVGEYSRLQEEVVFAADALKTATEEATKVRLENVSASSRMQVVDTAIPARKGSPSISLCFAACLPLVILGILFSLMQEYRASAKNVAASAAAPRDGNPLLNGSGGDPAETGDHTPSLPR